MKYFLVLFLTVNTVFVYSQNNDKLSFEIGINKHNYLMENVNQFYIDSFASPKTGLNSKLGKGNGAYLLIKYQPHASFDFGGYINYQYTKAETKTELVFTDGFGDFLETHQGDYFLKANNISLGIASSIYVSHFLKFKESKINMIQRLGISIEFDLGFGFSKASTGVFYHTYRPASYFETFYSTDVNGQVLLKSEFEFLKKPIFSSIGIKLGYQFSKTSPLHNLYDESWASLKKYPINLDFSGLFFGAYMTFGN